MWRRASRQMAMRTAITLAIATGLSACAEKVAPHAKSHPVLVTTAHNVSGGYERTFTGSVGARYESDLGFRTGGLVVARLVEVGQSVAAGDPLARLDPSDYELAVQAAEEQLQAARVDAEQAMSDATRFRRLLANHSVSVADHERQKARADAAVARQAQASRQLDLARNRQRYTTLVAEFAGVITSVRIETGQVVAEGQPVMTLAKPSELEVVADLPEAMAGSAGSFSASATFWGTPDRTVPLALREISPVAAARTRTFRARFSILDKSSAVQQELYLGMTTKLHLSRKGRELAAVLPATAVWKSGDTTMVWQVDNARGKLVALPVEVIRYTSEAVMVRGVPDGAKVVSAGIQKLSAGLDVVPVERSASGMNLSIPPVQVSMTGASADRR